MSTFDLSYLELDVVGEALGLNVRPFPFTGRFPVHGESIEDRKRLVGVVADSLAAKGLIDGTRFAPELECALGAFARGRLSVAMVGSARHRSYCARAVLAESGGVLAQDEGSLVRFSPLTPESLPHRLVGLLGSMKPGPGSSVTISAAGSRVEEDFASRSYLETVRPSANSEGARRAAAERIAARPRLGSGYFAVTTRGRSGREAEPLSLTWLDTDVGRYAIVPANGLVTYLPADLRRLEQNLARLVDALR